MSGVLHDGELGKISVMGFALAPHWEVRRFVSVG